jgi:hypothetical protein
MQKYRTTSEATEMDHRADLKDFSFVSTQCPPYPTRKARVWSYVGVAAAMLLACFLFSVDWSLAGLAGSLLVAMSMAWLAETVVSTAEHKFYVTRYELKDGQLTIEYTEKGEPKTLSGHGSEFVAKSKRNQHRRGRSPNLVIYRKYEVLLEQCMIGDWTESLCDSVVLSLGGKLPSGFEKWF